MNKIKVAIIGYGNIGQFAFQAALAAPDMEVVGIVRRKVTSDFAAQVAPYKVVDAIEKLGIVDVAVLATPTRSVAAYATKCLSLGISTVDSFDIHTEIVALRRELSSVAAKNGVTSIIAAGWDPGSDSVVRTLLRAIAPKGLTYTNFGPGMSMGHTVAVKAIEGVKDALSITIPLGTGIHRRMVYVELKEGYTLDQVAKSVKADAYFVKDDTHVIAVDSVDDVKDMGHGVHMTRKGVSGNTQNQLFTFDMKINNPALTGQVLICAARAALKQRPGCYTLIELPLIDLLYGEREALIAQLV
jgi:diaminopimelate dehydrogenase